MTFCVGLGTGIFVDLHGVIGVLMVASLLGSISQCLAGMKIKQGRWFGRFPRMGH